METVKESEEGKNRKSMWRGVSCKHTRTCDYNKVSLHFVLEHFFFVKICSFFMPYYRRTLNNFLLLLNSGTCQQLQCYIVLHLYTGGKSTGILHLSRITDLC